MFYRLSLKYKLFLLTFLIGISIFLFSSQIEARLAPRIFVTDIKINEITNNQINGEFTIISNEQYYLGDLNYEIKLYKGVNFEELKLLDVTVLEDNFTATPNGIIVKKFTYNYPQNITTDKYTLRAQVITNNGNELGWKDQVISLNGNNKFLDILTSYSRVLAGKEEFYPLEGANIPSDESVSGFLKIENKSETITVIPNIKIFKRQPNMPVIKEYQDKPITINKGEIKEINLVMPKFDVAESYIAEVKFLQNNNQVSGIQYFRWVVEGEGGKILNLLVDKDYYKAGENINLTIDTIGPADGTDIGNGTLEITITDKDKKIIFKTSKEISLSPASTSSTILIPVKNDLVSPTINAKLIKGSKSLDEVNLIMGMYSQEATILDKKIEEDKIANAKKIKTYLIYLLLSIITIIILFIIFLLFKKFKTNIPPKT